MLLEHLSTSYEVLRPERISGAAHCCRLSRYPATLRPGARQGGKTITKLKKKKDSYCTTVRSVFHGGQTIAETFRSSIPYNDSQGAA
jgi:hypothetical protein